jgi:ribonuclease HII
LGEKAQGVVKHIADGNLELGNGIHSIPKADANYPACSAASILAKVTQVRAMRELDKLHPGYGFRSHCGYGTPEHEMALARLGPCPAHRRSYAPVRKLLQPNSDDDLEGFLPR